MPPKIPPTLKKPIVVSSSSESESESEVETNNFNNIKIKKITKKKLIESDTDDTDKVTYKELNSNNIKEITKKTLVESETDESDEVTKKEPEQKLDDMTLLINITKKLDDMTLLINITKKEEELLKQLSDLHKPKMILLDKIGKKQGKNKSKKAREPQKPLKTIPMVIKKFIGCDADYTMMELSQKIREKLIGNGKEQIITQNQLKELKINEKNREDLDLEEVNKNELKEDVAVKLDKKEKYYRVKFGKLLSIVSFIIKQ